MFLYTERGRTLVNRPKSLTAIGSAHGQGTDAALALQEQAAGSFGERKFEQALAAERDAVVAFEKWETAQHFPI